MINKKVSSSTHFILHTYIYHDWKTWELINLFFLLTKETQTNFFMCDLALGKCHVRHNHKHKSPIIEKTKYLNK